MNPFITSDQKHYRRWINVLPGFLIPGGAQFLSGRPVAGMIWFLVAFSAYACLLGLLMHIDSPLSVTDIHLRWYDIACLIYQIGLIADACRRPIPRLGFWGWARFGGIFVALLLTPALLVRHYVVHPFEIPTSTMEPTLRGTKTGEDGSDSAGDHILVSKFAYRTRAPQRGDIVVFNTSAIDFPQIPKNTYYVKRIVGLPGETVSIHPPHVVVDGQVLKEPPIFMQISTASDGYQGYVCAHPLPGAKLTTPLQSLTLATDEYFVLGDNSRNSLDSRFYGPITRDSIVGKVFYIYAPAERKRWVTH